MTKWIPFEPAFTGKDPLDPTEVNGRYRIKGKEVEIEWRIEPRPLTLTLPTEEDKP